MFTFTLRAAKVTVERNPAVIVQSDSRGRVLCCLNLRPNWISLKNSSALTAESIMTRTCAYWQNSITN